MNRLQIIILVCLALLAPIANAVDGDSSKVRMEVDMLTIVLIGSSQSRAFGRGDGSRVTFTPRGYSAKHQLPAARMTGEPR